MREPRRQEGQKDATRHVTLALSFSFFSFALGGLSFALLGLVQGGL